MKRGNGLSLVEVLVALAIVGVIFAALAAALVTNLRVTADARAQSDLLEAAVVGFERVRTAILADFGLFDTVCSGLSNDPLPGNFQCIGNFDDPNVDYEILGSSIVGINGVIEAVFEARDGADILEFRQFISCLDAVATPSFSEPGICLLSGS